MEPDFDDPLWSHFDSLWPSFYEVSEAILIAGGYGLFLKHQSLFGAGSPIVIPFERWLNVSPRVTGDIDLVLHLDLIADQTLNREILKALENQGFEVSRQAHGKRWQFFKELPNDQVVKVELHAPRPTGESGSLKWNNFAVKCKPSLGDEGVHGRLNEQAVGSHIVPFGFELKGLKLNVPNPLTWTVMKLAAAEDQWRRSENAESGVERQTFARKQAVKHAEDVCRVVAMTTQVERDDAREVRRVIESTEEYLAAATIFRQSFERDEGWLNDVLVGKWRPDDLEIIRSILSDWYVRDAG